MSRAVVLARRAQTLKSAQPYNPLTAVAWDVAFWVEGPNFVALALADGASLTSWPDETANVRDASVGANKPTYKASVAGLNSKPAVEFNGTNNQLKTASFASLAQPNTMFCVFRFPSIAVTSSRFYVDGILTGSREGLGYSSGSSKLVILAGGSSYPSIAQDTTVHAMAAVFNGASSIQQVDGVEYIGNPGTNPITGISLGAAFDGTIPTNAQISFLGLFHGALTTQQRSDLLAWASVRYGPIVAAPVQGSVTYSSTID